MFQVEACVEGVRTLKSGTLKISIETQDIQLFTPEELSHLMKLQNKQCHVAFKESSIKPEDIVPPKVKPEFDDEKSPSQRLRNVLWVMWDQVKPNEDFDTWRKQKMEKIITHLKNQLD